MAWHGMAWSNRPGGPSHQNVVYLLVAVAANLDGKGPQVDIQSRRRGPLPIRGTQGGMCSEGPVWTVDSEFGFICRPWRAVDATWRANSGVECSPIKIVVVYAVSGWLKVRSWFLSEIGRGRTWTGQGNAIEEKHSKIGRE